MKDGYVEYIIIMNSYILDKDCNITCKNDNHRKIHFDSIDEVRNFINIALNWVEYPSKGYYTMPDQKSILIVKITHNLYESVSVWKRSEDEWIHVDVKECLYGT